jgi:hypothetical protein
LALYIFATVPMVGMFYATLQVTGALGALGYMIFS